jgi:hypothetical protein
MNAATRKSTPRRALRVTIQRRGGNPNADQIAEGLVRECVKSMFSTRMANTLRITVKLRVGAEFDKHSDTTRGMAQWQEQHNPKSKHYTIILRRDNWSQWPETIAHELAHVLQMAQGRLRHGSKGGVCGWFWREGEGRAVFVPHTGPGSIPYRSQPWEIDARANEHHGFDAVRSMNLQEPATENARIAS